MGKTQEYQCQVSDEDVMSVDANEPERVLIEIGDMSVLLHKPCVETLLKQLTEWLDTAVNAPRTNAGPTDDEGEE